MLIRVWVLQFITLPPGYTSTWLYIQFIYPNHYQNGLIPFFWRGGYPRSHSEWEARTLFNRDMDGLKTLDTALPDETYSLHYSLRSARCNQKWRFQVFALSTHISWGLEFFNKVYLCSMLFLTQDSLISIMIYVIYCLHK